MSLPLLAKDSAGSVRSSSDMAQGPAGFRTQTAKEASASLASHSPLLKAQGQGGAHNSAAQQSPVSAFELETGSGSGSSSSSSRDSASGGSWTQRMVVAPLKRRVWTPLLAILKSGATPEGLALSLAFGVTGGLFPVPATTTAICVAFAFIFKLNLAMVQLVNLLMTPLNLATFLTFIRAGEYIFGAQPVELSLEPFKEAPLKALGEFWISLCYGVVAWAILTPPATCLIYYAVKPVLRRAMAGMHSGKSAAD